MSDSAHTRNDAHNFERKLPSQQEFRIVLVVLTLVLAVVLAVLALA